MAASGARTQVRELVDRALFESRRGEWAKALDYAEQALAIEDGNDLAHKRRGLALWKLGRRAEAVEALARAAALNPEFASAHYNLACFYAQLGRREDMLEALRRAIELADEYMDLARQDADFEEYKEDPAFVRLTRPHAEATADLRRVFESDDLAAIADRLSKLGDTIPLAAVDWEEEGEGGALSEVLCRRAADLDTGVLRDLYRVIATRVHLELYDFDGWDALHRTLWERDQADFSELLVQCWRQRYEGLDPRHLGPLEVTMLAYLAKLPAEIQAQIVLDALQSHGPDALSDYRELCASALAGLAQGSPTAEALVDAVDRVLHGASFAEQPLDARRLRVVRALPPPAIELPEGTSERWAWERAALQSAHPAHLLGAARQLSVQRAPEARALLAEHQGRLVEIALDDSMPDDARIEAIEVLGRVGSAEVLAQLVPALDAGTPQVLFTLGATLRERGVPFDPETPARALVALHERASDWYEQYDVVRALRWFVSPAATQTLLAAAAQAREPVRREALYGLGYHGAEASVDTLLAQLLGSSGQCVTAAATALSQLDSERARQILRDPQHYGQVLEKARRDPRWATGALRYFEVPGLAADLFELFRTTNEGEALEPLAAGLAAHPSERLLVELVAFGLDAYRVQGRPGRYLMEIARAAVAANPDGPSDEVTQGLREALGDADEAAIRGLCERVGRDAKYATERDPEPARAERSRRAYAGRLERALAPLGEAAAALPWSLLGVSGDPPA